MFNIHTEYLLIRAFAELHTSTHRKLIFRSFKLDCGQSSTQKNYKEKNNHWNCQLNGNSYFKNGCMSAQTYNADDIAYFNQTNENHINNNMHCHVRYFVRFEISNNTICLRFICFWILCVWKNMILFLLSYGFSDIYYFCSLPLEVWRQKIFYALKVKRQ